MVSAQIGLYPLGQADPTRAIEALWAALRERDLEFQVGAMSTTTWGVTDAVFVALEEAFSRAAESGQVVMVITLSNACPAVSEPEA